MSNEIFPKFAKPEKKRDYYTTLWCNHMFALEKGIFGFDRRIHKFSSFLDQKYGGGRDRVDTLALEKIINRRGKKPFGITKVVPDIGEVKINLDRIDIIKGEIASSFWIQYGLGCSGFCDGKHVIGVEVTKEDHIKWLKENSYEDFINNNASEATKIHTAEGWFLDPKNDKLVEQAKAIRLKAIGNNCDV